MTSIFTPPEVISSTSVASVSLSLMRGNDRIGVCHRGADIAERGVQMRARGHERLAAAIHRRGSAPCPRFANKSAAIALRIESDVEADAVLASFDGAPVGSAVGSVDAAVDGHRRRRRLIAADPGGELAGERFDLAWFDAERVIGHRPGNAGACLRSHTGGSSPCWAHRPGCERAGHR